MDIPKCPDCEAEIQVPTDTAVGEILTCSDCGLELEVKQVGQGKIEVKEISIEKEDWGE